jgi:hypothetical protein
MGTKVSKPQRHPLPNVTIRRSRKPDIIDLGPRIRSADMVEIQAFLNVSGEEALEILHKALEPCWSIVVDGKVEMMFGATRFGEVKADADYLICAVGSDWVYSNPLEFLRWSRPWMKHIMDGKTGMNWVWEDNAPALRWLKHCGAELIENKVISGRNFIKFVIDGSKL